MIWTHAHLGGQITEHMILLMIFSTHAFSYHSRLWICSIFPHPARSSGDVSTYDRTRPVRTDHPLRACAHQICDAAGSALAPVARESGRWAQSTAASSKRNAVSDR